MSGWRHNTTASSTGSTIVTRGSWGDVAISGVPQIRSTTIEHPFGTPQGGVTGAAWKSVRTLLGVPYDMEAPTISNITDTSARMNWLAGNANGATFMHYEYQVALDPNFDTEVLTGKTTELFANLTFAEPGQTRHVRVRMIATLQQRRVVTWNAVADDGHRTRLRLADVHVRGRCTEATCPLHLCERAAEATQDVHMHQRRMGEGVMVKLSNSPYESTVLILRSPEVILFAYRVA